MQRELRQVKSLVVVETINLSACDVYSAGKEDLGSEAFGMSAPT